MGPHLVRAFGATPVRGSHGSPTVAFAVLGIFGCALFAHGFVLWRRKRAIEDTPTAKVRSVALGAAELEGIARPKDPLVAPVSGVPCAWYRYRIERETHSGDRREWTTVASGDSADWPFYLEDETGRVRVDPKGATAEIPNQIHETDPEISAPLAQLLTDHGIDCTSGWIGNRSRLRVSEARIDPGARLYVYGVAQARHGVLEERRFQIAARLAEIKKDPAAMKAADLDGDGEVSLEEWDAIRQRVSEDVDGQPVADRVVIARDPLGASLFVLSTEPRAALAHSLSWRALGSVFGGAALAIVSLALLLERFGMLGRM
ncbi:MAG TPA: GIDE domain-containing protein [Myxococcota bacterium]|nr:GIDE domain-containing protein [Myxococcota bacterium]